MDGFKREITLVETDNISERGFGKLSKGKFIAAQALFDEALKTNPLDVYAFFGKGIVLQNSTQSHDTDRTIRRISAQGVLSRFKLLPSISS